MNNPQIQNALDAFKKGGFVIVTDDEKRENEGDLFLLASAASKEKLAFMIRYTSGVICVAMTEARSRELHLPLMVKNNQDTKRTAFTVTVDAKAGITTGISAEERANTIRTLADPKATAEDFVRPGHIFPLIANEEGLLGRQGHTEAVVEMCRLVDDVEVGVISELVNEDGSMMRGSALQQFSLQHQIPVVTIASLVQLVRDEMKGNPKTQERKESPLHWADLPRRGLHSDQNQNWQITTFSGRGGVDHAVLRFGELQKNERVLLRIHSECLTGDVLGSLRCDCGSQLERAMSRIEAHGSGLVIYLRDQEGRGIGLSEKIRAYELQDRGLDTVEANLALGHDVDERDFADAAEVLRQLGLSQVTLLTNNPTKLQTLLEAGISATAEDLHGDVNKFNQKYIETKRERLGHK
jgi:3,4-dihydroxy 2-butanone 4-phosphate synthase/GTP cyclohydrolase II